MSDIGKAQSNPQPDSEGQLSDRLGYNIPSNEKFMPEESPQDDWQPEFDSLGKPEPISTLPAMPPRTSSNEGASSGSTRQQQQTYRRYHGHKKHRKHRRHAGIGMFWWILIPLFFMGRGHMDNMSWVWIVLLFCCLPGLGLMRRVGRHNPKALGALLVAGGAATLLFWMGTTPLTIIPILIIGLGLYKLADATGVLAHD